MAESTEPSGGMAAGKAKRRRLDTAALVVGYAMSRLDRQLLSGFGFKSWNAAFAGCGKVLSAPGTSVKNLRDEFDPIHPNGRRGWVGRPMLADRARVAEELSRFSDEALRELVRRILKAEQSDTGKVLDLLRPPEGAAAVEASRLVTGRRAEDFVLANAQSILGLPRTKVFDRRDHQLGFDFELAVRPAKVVEVKGLQGEAGNLLFTDREWAEAARRQDCYWLVVVRNIPVRPYATKIVDPRARLQARCRYETVARPQWHVAFRGQDPRRLTEIAAEQ